MSSVTVELKPLFVDEPWVAPEGALTGQFCKRHIASPENPDGTDCRASIGEGAVFQCLYASPSEAAHGIALDGVDTCVDFAPRTFGPDSKFRA